LDLIRNFVLQGGGLVATEGTSLKTEWGQRKRDFGLKDLLNVEAPALRELIYFDFAETKTKIASSVKSEVENGRVMYFPEIIPSIHKPSGEVMSNKYWKLPKNHSDLIQAVKWVAGDDLSIDVISPSFVTIELTVSEKKDKMMLHLLNYKASRGERVSDIKVIMKVPKDKKVHNLILVTPDREEIKTLPFVVKEGKVTFTVPDLEVYDLVVIEY
jgi:hypothetical protein